MKEQLIDFRQLTVTFIHCTSCPCASAEKFKETTNWLNTQWQEGNWEHIPPIIAVCDPDSKKLLIYDGNIRYHFAVEKDLQLKVMIINKQEELNEYFKNYPKCWFNIEDFNELLEIMGIYVAYPHEHGDIPADLKAKVMEKYYQFQQRQKREQRRGQMFGWTDDD